MSSLPLAQNLIEIQRGLTTSSTAIFIPFTTQELYQDRPEALYYGLNALSNNLIMVDRKALKNPNGLIFGTPGSGKSFSAKREIANAFLVSNDDIIICDPEAEYTALVMRLNGQVIKISPSSTQYINPMDINLNYSEEDNPIALKADFILSLCELVVGGKDIAGKECALITCCEEEDMSVMDGVRVPMERTAALLKWKMVGEVLIPGVLNVGDIEKTDGCKQAAALAEKI